MHPYRRCYLASPYTAPDPQLRAARYEVACAAAAAMLREGFLVFSPIAHSHPLAAYDLPVEFDFWRRHCLSFLDYWATELCVLTLPGWKESVGVAAEIDFALKLGLPVFLRDAHGNMEPYHV